VIPSRAASVPKLNQPGGNITGFAVFEASLGGKWLALLSEIAPGLKRAVIMFNPDTAGFVSIIMPSFETAIMLSFETAARSLKVALMTAPIHSDVENEKVITALGRQAGGGLVVIPDGGFTTVHRASIISAATRNNGYQRQRWCTRNGINGLARNIRSVATLWLRFRDTEKDRIPRPLPAGRDRLAALPQPAMLATMMRPNAPGGPTSRCGDQRAGNRWRAAGAIW
jgi:hypothetical protein